MDKVKAESIFDGSPVIGTIDIPESDPVDYRNIEREFLGTHFGAVVIEPNRVFTLIPNCIDTGNGVMERTKKVEELPHRKITKKSLVKRFKDFFHRNDFPNDNYKK